LQKSINSLKLRKACGIDGMMPQASSKATIGTLDPFIQSLPSAVHFPNPWKEAKT
jgi:hypothetical protein